MKIQLLKTKRRELKGIAEIYGEEFSKPPYSENWTLKKAMPKMKFFYRFYDLYTVRVNKKIVGFVVINPSFMCPGEIAFGEEIAIKKDFQGKGIGTLVIKNIMEIYKKRGYKSFMLIASKKSRAIKIYKKLGIKKSKGEILMEKILK